ncbi:MAG TPA: AsmA family protein [Xanthobacteraceae bacterium]|nr:AsmA family protein [Xanthobacteraceae bacterium]
MQGTLLGLGIAIILALVAALVGPHFVNWQAHRVVFESEVSRLAGLPVRINGPIDVRILPTPSVVLRDVEAAGSDEAKVKVGEAAVELALGPLLRGEWRATELRLMRPEFALRLDAAGRFVWPGKGPAMDVDTVSIERFSLEDGRALLSDQASGSALALDQLWFNGDMRSLAGPFKGEGGFMAGAEHYGYRIAAGRLGDDGLKLKFNLDPSDRPLAVEADGMLRLDRGAPRFEGALVVGRPAGVVLARGRAVATDAWRASSRVKLAPSGGLLEQIELQYGNDERAIKLTGTAQASFGKGARLDGVMSARQIDLDRAFGLPEGTRRLPVTVLRRAADAFAGVLAPPIPVRFGIGVDSVTLAGAALQTVRGDLASDGQTWDLETFEFRAPGTTQVRASGRLAVAADGASFTGPAVIESKDPKALLGWLEGRVESPQGQAGALRARGDLTLGSEKIAIERLKAEVDRKAVAGRLAYAWAAGTRPARLDAELTAAELDVDQTIAFGRAALAGTTLDAPGEVALAADVGVATIGGVAAKDVKAKLNFDAKGLVLERVAVADLGGAALDLNGRIDAAVTSPRGTLTLDITGNRLDGVAAVLAKYVPRSADKVRLLAPRFAPAKLSALLTVDRAESGTGSRAELVVTGKAGAARINLTGDATGDVANAAAADINLNGRIYADDGAALVALIGLDRAAAVDRRPASLSTTANGRLGDLHVDGRLAAPRLEATAAGTLHLAGDDAVAGDIDLKVAAADAVMLRPSGANQPVPATLKAHLAIKGGDLTFDNFSGVVAGTGVRGRLALVHGQPMRVDGRIEVDALDAAILAGAAAGIPASARADASGWPAEPFAPGVFADLRGQVAFEARRANVATLTAQDVRGMLRFGDGEVGFEDVEAGIAGGRAVGQLVLRSAPDGLVARGRLALTDVDAASVMPGDGRPPVTGRLGLQVEAEGSGLSLATLIGSLRGAGTVTLEGGTLAGLDPKAFATVMRAVDRGLTVDTAKIKDMTDAALLAGRLLLPRADGAFTLTAGQARWGNVVSHAEGGDLGISAVIDLSQWTLDARLMLSGTAEGPAGTDPPDVFIGLKGSLSTPRRTLDVAAFSGWLTLRAVERQAKQIEMLEGDRKDVTATTPAAPAPPAPPAPEAPTPSVTPAPPPASPDEGPEPPQARPSPAPRRALAPVTPPAESPQPLPPPIEVRPAPEPRSNPSVMQRPAPAPKPRTSQSPPPADPPPAAAPRSVLDRLFGPQR